ncbi:MAG: hypothetical protein Q9167_000603 [Letrouitia subvulpina]
MQVVIVVAYNLDNQSENRSIKAFAEDIASTTVKNLSTYPNAQSHPRIALYRDTLKAVYNLSAKKFPQSNESLYKRLYKEKKAPPPINPLVDFYNSVSIKYGITAGAFDLGELQTRSTAPLELRLSTAGDTFKALDARPNETEKPVAEGELVYVQEKTVLTRHLAWRQAAEALITEKTKNVIFMSEIFNEEGPTATPTKLAASVADEFVHGLKDFFGVEGRVTFLGHGIGSWSAEVENSFF